MLPICVPCHQFYRPVKTGFTFIEGMPEGDARPGILEADHWKPYKIWEGDKYRCPGCGSEIISGVARQPIAEHYQPDFKKLREMMNAEYQVNDCC